jgi:hypothetical protein
MGHTGRTLAAVAFIAAVAAVAVYCAQRQTVASGAFIADQLVDANPLLERLECDKAIPIRVDGATFDCRGYFKNGSKADYTFKLDRDMSFSKVNERPVR